MSISGVRFKSAQASDGSQKWRFSFCLIRVLERTLVEKGGWFSIRNRRDSTSKYSEMVSRSMSSTSSSRMSFFNVLFDATVASLRARERRSSSNLCLFRFLPSMRSMSFSMTALMYSLGMATASSNGRHMLSGQPPRTIASANCLNETSSETKGVSSPWHNASRETRPEEQPISKRDIGRMRSRAMRPVPLCIMPFRFGVDEPVRRKRPFSPDLSTSKRTASQRAGTSCHSSMSRGASPPRTREGSISANRRF